MLTVSEEQSTRPLVNLRHEPRFNVNQSIRVTILGNPEIWLSGRAREVSRSGMRLVLDRPARLGSAIKVEWNEDLLLGSVCYCTKENSSYVVGLRLFSSWESLTEEVLAREANDLARSNAELGQFVQVASHDLKEPLRTITSYLNLLQRRCNGKLDAEADQFIEYAVNGAARMSRLINDLLAYSQVSDGAIQFVFADCEAVFEQVIEDLRFALEDSGAMVTHDLLPSVMAKPLQLAQVLKNLISNAIKFRRQDPPRIHVSCKRHQEEWIFRVQDNGIGIAPEHFRRIFNMFERLHTEEEYPGTGIGLAICQKIVKLHGGRIWVESELGQGSAFYFTIPAREWAAE
jgi:light-regulated signal transduction histidine kinase (bacteriophytochrome)